ncbi:MAG TPA: hypothetical protein VNX28_16360, partial [Gemmataceae bacterium]|nr:hypothetical protein [Gemmataceae bacterium]
LFLVVFGNIVLAGKRDQIQQLNQSKNELEASLKSMAQEIADINALKDWDNTSISWLDELYDLTARFPDLKGFRITSLTANTSKKTTNKDKYVASMTLTGVAPAVDIDKITKVNELVAEINKSPSLRASIQDSKHVGVNQVSFQLKVDLMHRPPEKYTMHLEVPDQDDEDAIFGNGPVGGKNKGGFGNKGKGGGPGTGKNKGAFGGTGTGKNKGGGPSRVPGNGKVGPADGGAGRLPGKDDEGEEP